MADHIGFFGGSFDPIHFGHLHLALSMLESHGLDQVWFVSAHISPHKLQEPPMAGDSDRLEMVRLALLPFDKFVLRDDEIQRKGSSFTIDTVKTLLQSHPNKKFFLLLGDDALAGLPRWKEVMELLSLAPPLSGSRCISGPSVITSFSPELKRVVEKGWTDIPILDISSTYLRNRLKKRLYCGHLVPDKVLEYIYKKELYL